MEFYTYLHCTPDGVPFYVGKGFGKRGFGLRRNARHKQIVDQHGANNIGVFLFPCESEDQAFADEVQQIAQLRLDGYELTNCSNGGDGTKYGTLSPETRAKISSTRRRNNPSFAWSLRASLRKAAMPAITQRRKNINTQKKDNTMKRYNFFITTQLSASLNLLSKNTGLTVSDLIRRSIEDYVTKENLKLFQEWGRQGGVARSKAIGPERCAAIAKIARDEKSRRKKGPRISRP